MNNMNGSEIKVKLSYITGLRPVVLKELKQFNFQILDEGEDSVFVQFSEEAVPEIKHLRSVARAYVVMQGDKYHPAYISKHKSILGSLVEVVIKNNKKDFKSFKITCAGPESPEVRSISQYIQERYDLKEKKEAGLKIHIIKLEDVWEIGIQVTPRPLSVRDYRVVNMSGAMDPTIAYAVNSFCNLEKLNSYLNVFSGSATLLIEAAWSFPNLEKLVGFDNNKKAISLAMQNIKKAGLVKRIQLKEKNIFDKPDLGAFDVITSDLPFGMSIAKNENLEDLYRCFIEYCQGALNDDGALVVYTSEHEILKKIILKSKFKIAKTMELKFITAVGAYLKPKIFVCRFK